mmetsp:Transcript_6360/g.13142  ORF Transcript_6360/g.13142 Transcript_6360/m.13142 type:complete len:148 (+) Transcript_6360:1055-1498(+)
MARYAVNGDSFVATKTSTTLAVLSTIFIHGIDIWFHVMKTPNRPRCPQEGTRPIQGSRTNGDGTTKSTINRNIYFSYLAHGAVAMRRLNRNILPERVLVSGWCFQKQAQHDRFFAERAHACRNEPSIIVHTFRLFLFGRVTMVTLYC